MNPFGNNVWGRKGRFGVDLIAAVTVARSCVSAVLGRFEHHPRPLCCSSGEPTRREQRVLREGTT